MPGITRRLLESCLAPILISALCALAYEASLLPSFTIAAGACIVAILALNYLNMTDHLFAVRRVSVFYKTNYTVFAVNFVFSILLTIVDMCIDLNKVYTFLCLPYEAFDFLGINPILSALIVNIIFALEIFLMPYIAIKRRR